mgnify:CR=1 FL=1
MKRIYTFEDCVPGKMYKITNYAGQKISSGKLSSNQVNISGLQSGTYFITITDETGSKQTLEFIKN